MFLDGSGRRIQFLGDDLERVLPRFQYVEKDDVDILRGSKSFEKTLCNARIRIIGQHFHGIQAYTQIRVKEQLQQILDGRSGNFHGKLKFVGNPNHRTQHHPTQFAFDVRQVVGKQRKCFLITDTAERFDDGKQCQRIGTFGDRFFETLREKLCSRLPLDFPQRAGDNRPCIVLMFKHLNQVRDRCFVANVTQCFNGSNHYVRFRIVQQRNNGCDCFPVFEQTKDFHGQLANILVQVMEVWFNGMNGIIAETVQNFGSETLDLRVFVFDVRGNGPRHCDTANGKQRSGGGLTHRFVGIPH